MLPAVAFRPGRLFLFCAVLTAVAVLGAARIDKPMLGVFFGVGLLLGLVNALLVRHSVEVITAQASPPKSKMALNSMTRLAIITAVALVIATVFRPNGFGVLLGLAVFEVLLVATTALPVVNKLRNSAGIAGDPEAAGGAEQ